MSRTIGARRARHIREGVKLAQALYGRPRVYARRWLTENRHGLPTQTIRAARFAWVRLHQKAAR